jgi:hypothetical protein
MGIAVFTMMIKHVDELGISMFFPHLIGTN